MPVRIVIVVGAARPGNLTSVVAARAAERLVRAGAQVDVVHPGALSLPLPGTGADHPGVVELRDRLARADAVLLATPEYQGSFSSLLKLALEHLGWPAELHDKPVGLLGVAAGAIGAIKSLEHLRSVASHLGGRVLAQPVSIARVTDGLDPEGRLVRPADQQALDGLCATLLGEVARESQRRAA